MIKPLYRDVSSLKRQYPKWSKKRDNEIRAMARRGFPINTIAHKFDLSNDRTRDIITGRKCWVASKTRAYVKAPPLQSG